MNAVEIVHALLADDADVVALVGQRMYPVKAREAAADPHLVMTTVSDVTQNSLDGDTSGFHGARVQVDCYSRRYDQAKQLAKAVRNVLRAQVGASKTLVLMERDMYEDETEYHRAQVDVSVWYYE